MSQDAAWERATFGGYSTVHNNPGFTTFLHDTLELGVRVAAGLDLEWAEGAETRYWWLAVGNKMLAEEAEESRYAEEEANQILEEFMDEFPDDESWEKMFK